jgi:glycosyltransferase involved in cell wall biosynthesis
MSVWHIVTSEYPPDVGGVSDYTCQVAEGLARMGDEVHVWCPRAADRASTPRLQVHPDLGGIGPGNLARLGQRLDEFPAPRRLLVQWVPHGFGYHSMNVWFCVWLAMRAWSGDDVELMVHEPYLEFRRGPLRHTAMALVHRVMTILLLAAARKVWMSIPAWESRLRPYALGRAIPMQWLPVPGCVGDRAAVPAAAIRLRYAPVRQPLLAHFGSYGSAVTRLLEERLPPLMDGPLTPSLLLLGSGSDQFRDVLLEKHPSWKTRVHAAGYLPAADLSAHIAACDVFVQPYPDGITSRRTSAMVCLSHAKPVVTTSGHLTEPLWAETGAVTAVDVDDPAAFTAAVTDLLGRDDARRVLGLRGQHVYVEHFSVTRVVDALRAA